MQDNNNQQEDNHGPRINPNVFRYYLFGLIIIMVLNFVIIPKIAESRVLTSSYSEFRHMIEDNRVQEVSFDENQIMFIALNEDGVKRIYKTGLMDDPNIIQPVSYTHLDVYKRQGTSRWERQINLPPIRLNRKMKIGGKT